MEDYAYPSLERKDRIVPDNQQLLFHIILDVLPKSLGPYVRRRLTEDRPELNWSSPTWEGASREALDLDDLSTQIFALTGRDENGRSILVSDPGLRSKLQDLGIVHNRLVHGATFERSEVILAVSEAAEVLRLIGDEETSERVFRFIADGVAADTERRAVQEGSSQGAGVGPASSPVSEPESGLKSGASARDVDATSSRRAIAMEGGASAGAQPPGTELETLSVTVDTPPVVSYAHAVAGLRLASTVRLSSTAAQDPDTSADVVAQLLPESDLRLTVSVEVDGVSVASAEPVTLSHIKVNGEEVSVTIIPERAALLQLDTQSASRLHVCLELADAQRDFYLDGPDVLSPRQWMMRGRTSEAAAALVAFVQPQQPRLALLCSRAAHILGISTGSTSLDGYQSGPKRVTEIVESLCQAVQDESVAYAVPPTSWAEVGQRVRTAEDVLDNRLGTCLDTTVLMASVLEYLGIEPLLIILPGHALLGYWRTEHHVSEDLTMAGWELLNQIDRGDIGLVETTLLTGGSQHSLEQIHQTARQRIGIDASDIEVIIPVRVARQRGVMPMPLRSRNEHGEVVESTYVAVPRPQTVVLPEEMLQAVQTRQPRDKAPDRVEMWKAKLLDLSLRNRLINCSDSAIQTHKIVELAVPEAVIGSFEDLINVGIDVTLRQAGERAQAVRRAGGLFREELDPPRLAPLLGDHREVEVDLAEETYDSVLRGLRASARTLTEETGANNLYLALGSLVWKTHGKTIRSPLVFIPVDLERRSARSPFRLRIDPSGTTTPNYSLIERLRVDLGLDLTELSEPEEDNAGLNLPSLFDIVRRFLADNRLPFHVEATTYLGIFQFGSFRLWKDLEESWQDIARNPLVKHLIESPDQEFYDPCAEVQVADLEELLPRLPIPADASQADVVAQALAGKSIVVEGPPGTGKSQTITNVIISAVAEGKKVLFVAEKKAALEVVARRLREAGIGDLVLDLHDRKQAPDAVRRKIVAAMDLEAHPDHVTLQSRWAMANAGSARLADYRSSLHRQGPAGLSFYSARESQIAYSRFQISSLTISPKNLAALSVEDVASLRSSAPALGARVEEYRDVLSSVEPVLSKPISETARAEAHTRMGAWDGVCAAADDSLLTTVRWIPEAQLGVVELILADPYLDGRVFDLMVDPAWAREAQSLVVALEFERSASHAALIYYQQSVLDESLAKVREALIDAKNAFFGKTKKAEKALAPLASHRTGVPMPDNGGDLLAIVDELIALAARREQLRHLHSRVMPWTAPVMGRWSPYEPTAVLESMERLRQLLRHASMMVSGQLGQARAAVDSLALRPDRAAVSEWIHSYSQARYGVSELVNLGVRAEALSELLSYSPTKRERVLRGWSEFLACGEDFQRLGLGACLDPLRCGEVSAADMATALDVGLVDASLKLLGDRGNFENFSANGFNETVRQYASVLDEIRTALPESLIFNVLKARNSLLEKERLRLAKLRTALERKRKKRKIRDLIGEFGDLITALTPCVLVSPDSVARFFPADRQDFDIVVFDEASQITVASAVGAMGRGCSVVVCGDSKQMPPTSFAELSRDDGVEDDVMDEESILSECVAAHVPRLWLSWHYRSQVESLIAFSNVAYYEGRLSSFPSPVALESDDSVNGYGISLRRVNGMFVRQVARGQSRKTYRTNEEEARAIVDEVRRRFAAATDPDGPSVGVVTFNIQQRDLIESKLRELDDPKITASLDADDGVFVKNLENVQGDERDTILFSIAFSAREDGQIPLNFGPLNRQGGERRLNVAVTRARRQVILFCSFDPSHLQAERSASRGLQDLKRYLLFAQQGAAALPGRSTKPMHPDGHRDEIAQALRDRDVFVRVDVGLSDFRIDLVLSSPNNPESPTVAVLLDGDGWGRRRTAYDRDVLPTRVLMNMLRWPRVERVWMPEWLQSPERVIARLVEAVREGGVQRLRCDENDEWMSNNAVTERWPDSEFTLQSSEMLSVESQHPLMVTARGGDASFSDASQITSSVASQGVMSIRDFDAIGEFVPYEVEVVGDREMLNQGEREPGTRMMVRELAERICAVESPVSQDRLLGLVCRSFGLQRVTSVRREQVRTLMQGARIFMDPDGFAWPLGADPESMTGYRRHPLDHISIEEIHPRELDNYVAHRIKVLGGTDSHEELLLELLRNLGSGRRRLTASVRIALERSAWRVSSGGRTE